jgi:hypothetical protein
MINLLRRLWLPRRYIFRYRVGSSTRYADPLQIDSALSRHGGKEWLQLVVLLDTLRKPLTPAIAAAKSPTGNVEEGAEAHRKQFESVLIDVVGIVRKSFDLKPLDAETGDGVTDAECIDVLLQYLDFAEKLGEEVRPLA